MSEPNLGTIRAILEATQTRVGQSLGSRDRRNDIAVERIPDRSDEAQLAVHRELTTRVLNHESCLLSAVRLALARIEDGTYGICASCGRPIGAKRLTAVPWASYCITCQATADERGDAQGRDGS